MSSIKVEEKDILIPLVTRIVWSLIASYMNYYFISALIDTKMLRWIDIHIIKTRVSFGIVVGIVVGFLTFLFIIYINRFLVWLSKRWSFKRFLQLERTISKFVFIMFIEMILFFLCLTIVIPFPEWSSPLPEWVAIFFYSQTSVLYTTVGFSSLFTRRCRATLCLEQFANDYKRDPSKADFKYLQLGSQNIARWLKKEYQIRVSPTSLAFGMTLASLENRSKKSLDKIISGLKNPYDPKLFSNFRSSIQNFLSIAGKSCKKGIGEKSSFLAYEKFMEIVRYIVIPVSVAFIALIPEIMKMLEG